MLVVGELILVYPVLLHQHHVPEVPLFHHKLLIVTESKAYYSRRPRYCMYPGYM